MPWAMRLTKDPTNTADIIAILAMVIAILAIVWARIEIYGTGDIEDALAGEISSATRAVCTGQHEALVRNRWIAGFNQ